MTFESSRPSIQAIQSMVCDEFGISLNDLLARRRSYQVIWPRFTAIWLARGEGHSTNEIGRAFDHRDHTTVMNAEVRIMGRIMTDQAFAARLVRLADRVDAHGQNLRQRMVG